MLKVICSIVIIIASIAIVFVKQNESNVMKEQARQSAVIESLEQAITLEDLKTEALNKKKEKANSDENIEASVLDKSFAESVLEHNILNVDIKFKIYSRGFLQEYRP